MYVPKYTITEEDPMERQEEQYEPGDVTEYVPMQRWGRDHWTTLAYLETCVVNDANGRIDNRKMRCNPRRHRPFYYHHPYGPPPGPTPPTRLQDGDELEKHDDWNCAEDMAAHGLLRLYWWVRDEEEVFGFMRARVEFTERGLDLAHQLRRHKAAGGTYSTFTSAS